MLTASEAKFKSVNGKKYHKIIHYIEQEIIEAAEAGKCQCRVSIDIDTNSDIREKILKDLSTLGYSVEISDNASKERNCPVDQRSYYDDVTVSWG